MSSLVFLGQCLILDEGMTFVGHHGAQDHIVNDLQSQLRDVVRSQRIEKKNYREKEQCVTEQCVTLGLCVKVELCVKVRIIRLQRTISPLPAARTVL